MKNKKYDDILLKLQTTMYDMSIKDLEIYLMALSDYVEQRKLCELMCGGVKLLCANCHREVESGITTLN